MIKSGKKLSRRTMLKATAAVMATSALSARATCSGTQNPQPSPTGTTVNTAVTVAATSVGSIGFGFGALAPEKVAINQGYSSLNGNLRFCDSRNTNAVNLLKTLAPNGGILRVGGDNTDMGYWNPTGSGQQGNQFSPKDVDALAGFLQATGYKALYGINLGGSGPNTVAHNVYGYQATTTTLAAEEALYVVNKLGIYNPTTNPSGLLYALKLGNEPDLWATGSTKPYYGTTWNESVYEGVWLTYYNAVMNAVPGAPMAAPAISDAPWITSFGPHQGSKVNLLTCHHYRTAPSPAPTPASLLTPDSYLNGTVLPDMVSASTAAGVPFAMTEGASIYGTGVNGVSNSYAATLWTIDYIFTCALSGAKFVAFESGGAAQTSYSNVSNYYSPIQEYFGYVQDIQSEYYGIQFFNLAGQGTLYQTSISANGLNATAYAILTSSGGINVIVQNKSSTNLNVTLTLPAAYSCGTLIELTQSTAGAAPDITATSGITIQGSGVAIDGTFTPNAPYTLTPSGDTASFYVPAYSSVLAKFS